MYILGDVVYNKGVPVIIKQTFNNETVYALLAKNKDVRVACAGCFKRDMRITYAFSDGLDPETGRACLSNEQINNVICGLRTSRNRIESLYLNMSYSVLNVECSLIKKP